jgi:hypothetical protein
MKRCIDCKHCEPIIPSAIVDPLATCKHPSSKVMIAEILNHSYFTSCNSMRISEDKCGEDGKMFAAKFMNRMFGWR